MFEVGNPRFANPLNNPLLKARPAKFTPAKPAQEEGKEKKRRKEKRRKGEEQTEHRTPNTEHRKTPCDFSSNSAAGRKAGLPFQPRPKQGHRAFGRRPLKRRNSFAPNMLLLACVLLIGWTLLHILKKPLFHRLTRRAGLLQQPNLRLRMQTCRRFR